MTASNISIPTPAPGFKRNWSDDFTDLSQWEIWNGNAGGGYNCDYNPAQTNVRNSVLTLGVRWNPQAQRWHSGGVGRKGNGPTYAHWTWASRLTGSKTMRAECADLGWPTTIGWPKGGELDFDETDIGWATAHGNSGASTLHWGANNSQQQQTFAGIDMFKWHLFEAIWAPGVMSFAVDGKQVTNIASANVPSHPMHLVFETLTRAQTPTTDFLAQQIDWCTEDVPA